MVREIQNCFFLNFLWVQGSMLWRKRVTAMAAEYPEVEVSHLLIDTAALDLVRHPRQGPGIFEPVHGSAPKHYGKDTVNPMAAVLSAAMLLRYGLKEENAANRIKKAVSDVLDRGFRTRDIHTPGPTLVGCKRMGEEILRSLDARVSASIGSLA